MSVIEGLVTTGPLVFRTDSGEGPVVGIRSSFWLESDTYERGATGRVQLLLPPEIARALASRLAEEAGSIDGSDKGP